MSNFVWTWINGNSDFNPPSSPASPSGRRGAAAWKGIDGNFYLFGGLISPVPTKLANDLWKYNPNNNQWSLLYPTSDNAQGVYNVLGSDSASNWPGVRRVDTTWVTSDGLLYMFGGFGNAVIGGGHLNDLWRYNPKTGFWAFLGGGILSNQLSTYTGINAFPGGRENTMSTIGADGQLYLFGGFGFANTTTPGWLNDLWRYNPTTNSWTFLKGGQINNQSGRYGSLGVPDSNNYPGARLSGQMWTGVDGSLYLFGGSINGSSFYNDMWRYNPSTNQWTWIKGASDFNKNSVYTTPYVLNPNNTPGSRDTPVGWKTSNGNFFLFGGGGFSKTGSRSGTMNDLWIYDVPSNQWAFIKGSDGINNVGSYGILNVVSDGNLPRARNISVGWVGNDDALYLFGGLASTGGFLNDLWRGTMPCELAISDFYTFPQTIIADQNFNMVWTLQPSIFPANYQAIVTFKGIDYSDIYTTFTGTMPLPPQPAGTYSDVRVRIISRAVPNCSDMKSVTVNIINKDVLPIFLACLKAFLISFLLIYIGMLFFFLRDSFNISDST